MNRKSLRLRQICVMALLCAIAYITVTFIRIPVIPGFEYLRLDVKDAFLVIGGFLFGPLAGGAMAVVVALIEMITVSESGILGFLMNALSSALFVCTAAAVYRHRKTLKNAVIGLLGGCAAMTGGMLLWNILITPLYTGMPRAQIFPILLPVFLPFNLIKGILNAAVALLLYKSVVTALRRAHLLPPENTAQPQRRIWPFALAMLVAVIAVVVILKITG